MFAAALTSAVIFATSFTLSADGLVTVEARINGAGPFRLMLDTGSNRSAVSRRLAQSLGLSPVTTGSVVSAGGTEPHDIVRLTCVTLGPVAKQGLLVPVLENRAIEAIGAGVEGIIGQDVLLDQNYTLDYEHRRLSWNAGATPVSGTSLPLVEAEGRWLVSLPQANGGTTAARFVPDSGAAGLIVFDRGSALPVPTAPLRPLTIDTRLTTINGAARTRAVLVSTMAIGSIVWKNRPALIVERREPDAPEGDGLLPLSAFASITFDAERRLMIVRARQGGR